MEEIREIAAAEHYRCNHHSFEGVVSYCACGHRIPTEEPQATDALVEHWIEVGVLPPDFKLLPYVGSVPS